MLNRDVFHIDPAAYRLANDGVAKLTYPTPPSGVATLRSELSTFVCDGEYARGLDRILNGFLGRSSGSAPAAWISGFFGSGKSHLASMLAALWTNPEFEDGARAESLIPHLPAEVIAHLKELRAQGKRAGGLLAAGDTLGRGPSDPVEAVLHVLLRAGGLPEDVRAAQVALWLHDEGALEAVRASLGDAFDKSIRSPLVSPRFQEAVLSAAPKLARDAAELRTLLKHDFPSEVAMNVQLLESLGRRTLTLGRKELPLTLVVLDEVQQFINQDPAQTLKIQNIAETLSGRFDGRVLLVATGQQALTDVEQLQKLLGRFPIQVALGDADIDGVIRKTVLRKKPEAQTELRAVLDARSGEISRHLQGSKLAHTITDGADAVADWPILPSRRRVWERVLRGLDPTGLGGTLRGQLRTTLDAARAYADRPLGHAVPVDFFYLSFAAGARNQGLLPAETSAAIDRLAAGNDDDRLKSRLLVLIYMLSRIAQDADRHGVRATPATLADLLIIDLAGEAELRRRVPDALAALADDSLVVEVDGVWQIQTRESAEWDRAYRQEQTAIRADAGATARVRSTLLDEAIEDALRTAVSLQQGAAKEPRRIVRLRPGDKAPADAVVLRVRSGWDEPLEAAEREAAEASPQEAAMHLLIGARDGEALQRALVQRLAAERVLQAKGPPSGEDAVQARDGLETRRKTADTDARRIVKSAVESARVVLAGGGEQSGNPAEAVRAGAVRALARLYPRFDEADDAGWSQALDKAKRRDPQALKAVGHAGDAHAHAVCKAVLEQVGGGRKGRDLLEALKAPPFGWPEDAIVAAATALANADELKALGEDGRPVVLAELDKRKFSAATLKRENVQVGLSDRLKVQSLMSAAGVKFEKGAETAVLPALLDALMAAAARSGGPAPAPGADVVPDLTTLRGLSGNELLLRVAGEAEALKAKLTAWAAAGAAILARLPRFHLLAELVRLGAAEQAAALDAIREGRRLLEEPDPVPPLVTAAADGLRARLREGMDLYEAARAAGEARLAADPVWGKLTPEQKAELRAEFDLRKEDRPPVDTPEAVREALQRRSLEAWRDAAGAVRGHVDDLVGEAAALLEPTSQDIALPRGLLKTEADVDGWLAEARARLLAKLPDGPVIPKL